MDVEQNTSIVRSDISIPSWTGRENMRRGKVHPVREAVQPPKGVPSSGEPATMRELLPLFLLCFFQIYLVPLLSLRSSFYFRCSHDCGRLREELGLNRGAYR